MSTEHPTDEKSTDDAPTPDACTRIVKRREDARTGVEPSPRYAPLRARLCPDCFPATDDLAAVSQEIAYLRGNAQNVVHRSPRQQWCDGCQETIDDADWIAHRQSCVEARTEQATVDSPRAEWEGGA